MKSEFTINTRRTAPREPFDGPSQIERQRWLGCGAGGSLILHRGASLTVGVGRFVAYPNGFDFTLSVRATEERSGDLGYAGLVSGSEPPSGRRLSSDEVARFAVIYADGRALLNRFNASVDHTGSGEASLELDGASGDPGVIKVAYWASPLPPRGPIRFAFEWPALGIGYTRRSMSSAGLLVAAKRAELLEPGRPAT